MEWCQISIITLLVYWTIGITIYIATKENENFAMSWSFGIVFPILWILAYPIREWNSYKSSIGVYKKYNLSYWEKLIGKGLYKGQKMWKWEIKKFYKNMEEE